MPQQLKTTSYDLNILAEDIERFFLKQKSYSYGMDSPNAGKDEKDYQLSTDTLNKVRDTADLLVRASTLVGAIELLLSDNSSETHFRTIWKELKLDQLM